MPCLHILNKVPGEPRFEACISDLAGGDTLLLIENAVIAIADNMTEWPEGVELKALQDDVEARGLHEYTVSNGWACVGYADFVTLTTESEKVVCW